MDIVDAKHLHLYAFINAHFIMMSVGGSITLSINFYPMLYFSQKFWQNSQLAISFHGGRGGWETGLGGCGTT